MSTLLPDPPSRFAYILGAVLALALGAGWYALHRASAPGKPAAATPTPATGTRAAAAALPPVVSGTATLADAERHFATWGGYSIWENDVTEFALWSLRDRDYTQCFEVRRLDGRFTFRRPDRLTRPLIDHGQPVRAPMAFTETEAMRAGFYRQNPHFQPTRPTASADQPPVADGRGQAGPDAGAALLRGSALVFEISRALARSGQRADFRTQDLLALFQLHPVRPITDAMTAAEFSAVLAERAAANDSIATMAVALLPPGPLKIFRATLEHEITGLARQRRG